MMNLKPSSDEWNTPKWIAELLGNFDLDPCSNPTSHIKAEMVCELPTLDGLKHNWKRWSVFCNPPYSNMGPWARKLAEHQGAWCALVRADPTTRWYATLMTADPVVAPFRKRIKFDGPLSMTANFPSVLIFKGWTPSEELREHLW